MILARAADVQEIGTGVGYRPMWRVEPTDTPRRRTVSLTGATVGGERADTSSARDGFEPGGVGEGRANLGVDGHPRLTLRRVPTAPRHSVV